MWVANTNVCIWHNNIHHQIFSYFLWPTILPLGRSPQIVIFNESSGNKEVCAAQIGPSSRWHEQLQHKLSVTGLRWTAAKIPWWWSYCLHLKLPIKIFFMAFELKLFFQQLFCSNITYESYWNWIVRED